MSRITDSKQLVLEAQYKLSGAVFDPIILANNASQFIYKGPDKEDDTLHVFVGSTDGTAQYLPSTLFDTDLGFASVDKDE